MASLLEQQLRCPRCGAPRVLLKVIQRGIYKSAKRVIDTRYIHLVARCPRHGSAGVTMPFHVWDDVAAQASQSLLLCKKCGKPCTPVQFRMHPEVSVITIACPVHRIDHRQVSTSLAGKVWQEMSQPLATPTVPAPPPAGSGVMVKYCPACGSPVEPTDQFCALCGRQLR